MAVSSCFLPSSDKLVLTSDVPGYTEQIFLLPQPKPAWDSGMRAVLWECLCPRDRPATDSSAKSICCCLSTRGHKQVSADHRALAQMSADCSLKVMVQGRLSLQHRDTCRDQNGSLIFPISLCKASQTEKSAQLQHLSTNNLIFITFTEATTANALRTMW